jgi:hypothetical protein
LEAADEGGGEQVNVDPAAAAAFEITSLDELDDLPVRDGAHRAKALIGIEKVAAASCVAHHEFSIDQLVRCDLIQS